MPAIIRLFFDGSPTAIIGSVRTAVVDAVKLMRGRWFTSHVGKEIFVNIPAWIHRDATPTIAFPIFIFGIVGAVACARPTFPFWCAARPIAVAGICAPDSSVFVATARSGCPTFQIVGSDNFFIAAIASNKPVSIATACVGQLCDDQQIEALTYKIENLIFTLGHTPRYTIGEA